MLKKIIITTVLFASIQTVFSQSKETCDSPDEPIEDLNSITKCSVETSEDKTSKNAKRVTIEVSSRKRVIRKRKRKSSANNIDVNAKLASIKKNSSLVGKLDLSSNKTAEKLPFNFVEEKPTFKACETVALVEQTKCFKDEISKHVSKYFKYPEKSYNASIQGRVLVQFVIDEQGNIGDIITRGPIKGDELEEEAKRIISKLPKLNPGKIAGQNIKVKYGVPIAFKIPGRKPSNVRAKKEKVLSGEVVNFAAVDNIPVFKACDKKGDKSLDCFNTQMVKHVQKYFAYPEEAVNNNIQGRVFALFVIDKNGDVVNIKTKGPKGGELLELSAKKVFEKLPKFIPGKHKGANANVKYAFPINFKLN